jgi:hypothetical protein
MLDEAEWAEVVRPRPGTALPTRLAAILETYHRLTGFKETNANAVMHHRLAAYGPPCASCGKPLRTPRASFCAACGVPKSERS